MWTITEKFVKYFTVVNMEVFTDNNPLIYLYTAKPGVLEQRWVTRLARLKYKSHYTVSLGILTGVPMLCPAIQGNAQGRMWTLVEKTLK